MRKVILSILYIVLSFLVVNQQVFAHVLETDKKIGGVLHVDPEDDPIVGKETSFFIELKDVENRFDIKNCNCIARVFEDNKKIYEQPVAFYDNSLTFRYTFSHKNIYTIEVSGKPINNNSFQPFVLRYDIRVSRVVESSKNNEFSKWISAHVIHLIGAIGIAVFVIGAIINEQIKKRSSRSKT